MGTQMDKTKAGREKPKPESFVQNYNKKMIWRIFPDVGNALLDKGQILPIVFMCHMHFLLALDEINIKKYCKWHDMKHKNTKNWYTIDALGAIFAIFTIPLKNFYNKLQYYDYTLTILLQYSYKTPTIHLQ